jgi:GNAT superfamily N-acetyltransferase
MPAMTAESPERLCAEVSRRWRDADPLLPAASGPPPGCGTELVVADAQDQAIAIGSCEHWQGEPQSLDLAWGARRRFQLTVRVAAAGIAAPLDRLLASWRSHLETVPEAAEEDSAAVVLWPSRDIDGIRVLLEHGLAPRGLVAGRVTGRERLGRSAGGPGSAGGDPRSRIEIRRAGRADLDVVAQLGLEVIEFDAHFGGVIERPGTADALRHEVGGALAAAQPWTWLAERDGEPVGLLHAERPEATGWIAPLVRPDPVAYLTLMLVRQPERARGLGGAMVAQYHAEVEAAGAAVSLLHYEQTNPLSAPFWSQQGYRPVWTSWEARPARTMR